MGAPSGNPRDVVVFVHGTFACSDADEGTAWWQRGSDFWNWMKANLPPDTELPETGPAFRWTGINSESARMQGAKALLLRLQSYESAGVGYHVVAHSHGGSVVWTALHLARHGVDVKELKSLRSWTTVGTPFLVPEPSPAATFARLWDAILLVGIAVVADAHYFGFLRRVSPVFFVTLVCSLFLALLVVGWRLDLQSDQRLVTRVATTYGERWLGLWSSQDEAIEGLRVSRLLSGRLIPRRPVMLGPFWDWSRLVLYAPVALAQLLLTPVRNSLAPIADRFVWASLRDAILGNDRPGLRVKAVSGAPIPAWIDALGDNPGLPEQTDAALIVAANESAQHSVPHMRALIGRAAAGIPLAVLRFELDASLSGDELVHTSYFGNEDVRRLICAHITLAGARTPPKAGDDAADWVRSRKRAVAAMLDR